MWVESVWVVVTGNAQYLQIAFKWASIEFGVACVELLHYALVLACIALLDGPVMLQIVLLQLPAHCNVGQHHAYVVLQYSHSLPVMLDMMCTVVTHLQYCAYLALYYFTLFVCTAHMICLIYIVSSHIFKYTLYMSLLL